MPPTLQAGGMRSFLPSLCKLLKLSAHLIVTTVHLQYQTTGCMTITSKEGPKPEKTIMCFVIRKTTLELECTILITLYLADAKNTDKFLT
jgi:hypothetical protein